jgi:hypothetical protein
LIQPPVLASLAFLRSKVNAASNKNLTI